MATLFFTIAALALLNAARLAALRRALTLCKVARVVTQRVARKANRVRCTFAA